METSSELTVILKGDDEITYRQKFLLYGAYFVTPEDPVIKNCIHIARQNIKSEATEIQIKIHLEVA